MTVVYAGLSTGAIYALVAIGYNLTLVTGSVLNFAFANIVMLGGFIGYWAFGANDLPLILGFAAAALVGAAVGAAEERVAIRPLRGLGAHTELITTVGVATAITGVLIIIWGSDPHPVEFGSSGDVLSVLGGRLRVGDVVLIVVALVLAMGFYAWTRRTKHGLAALAQSEDREAAMLRGINVRRYSLLGFVAAGAIAGLIGPLVATVTTASAFTSLVLAVKGFIALTIGGVGSQTGALVGGLLIGLAEAASNYYLGSSVGNVAVFVVFLVVVLARPAGFFGTKLARTV